MPVAVVMSRLSAADLRQAHAEDAAERAAVVSEEAAAPAFARGTRPRYGPPAKASDASKKFLRDLLAERSGSEVDEIRATLNAEREAGRLTQRTVSASIDRLKAIPKDAPAAPVAAE